MFSDGILLLASFMSFHSKRILFLPAEILFLPAERRQRSAWGLYSSTIHWKSILNWRWADLLTLWPLEDYSVEAFQALINFPINFQWWVNGNSPKSIEIDVAFLHLRLVVAIGYPRSVIHLDESSTSHMTWVFSMRYEGGYTLVIPLLLNTFVFIACMLVSWDFILI